MGAMCQGSIYHIRFLFVPPLPALRTGTVEKLGERNDSTGPGGLDGLPSLARLERREIAEDSPSVG